MSALASVLAVFPKMLESIVEEVPTVQPTHNSSKADKAWKSILFCILSSQTSVEKAQTATEAIALEFSIFDSHFAHLPLKLESVLCSPNVRHRFPRTKAKQISYAWFVFAQIKDEFDDYIAHFSCERDARDEIASKFDGLGYKQSSMLLRDLGYAKSLAVIDAHILWFVSRVWKPCSKSVSKSEYLEIEDILRAKAENYGVTMSQLDLAIWSSVRTVRESYA